MTYYYRQRTSWDAFWDEISCFLLLIALIEGFVLVWRILEIVVPWLIKTLWKVVKGTIVCVACFLRWIANGIVKWRTRRAVEREAAREREYARRRRLAEKVALAREIAEGACPEVALQALDLMRVYARQGSAEAACLIAQAFWEGTVVPRNPELAWQWHEYAGRLG